METKDFPCVKEAKAIALKQLAFYIKMMNAKPIKSRSNID
jgi:hypothetical protein